AAAVRTGSPVRVGVFVHQDLDEVEWIMKTARLDLAQLHGGQDLDFCRRIGRKRVVKVLWPEKISSNKELVKEMDRFSEACSWFLLDGGFSGGGHGRTLEWSSFADIHPPRPWLLAGGLGPGNVSDALRVCHPDGVDLNSGVENSPGKKDSSKLKSCIQAIRSFSS
ncbi:MAG: phosphoribosylanthranilate isomerase, partial [Desulfovibrionales bacterium]